MTIVLDDYHWIDQEEVHQLIIQLVETNHSPIQLMLISRFAPPPLPLQVWKQKNWLVEVRASVLKLTAQELMRALSSSIDEIGSDWRVKGTSYKLAPNVVKLSSYSFIIDDFTPSS